MQAAPAVSNENVVPVIGEQVGKYVVERVIGTGGMGIVVGARHEENGDRVAIKLLNPKAAQDRIQLERFVREARAIVRVKSDHVVRVLDAGAQQGTDRPFIVMEFLVGKDLGKILQERGPLPWQVAVEYVLQACEGVASAHAQGIVHRDLKPSNFFLTQRADGTALVKVLDFGISKTAPDGNQDAKLTETTAVFGSPTYMSPEQIRSSKNVDARSDVWSMAVALYELLSGRLPFMADNVPGLLASIIADPPVPLARYAKNLPPGLEAIIFGCLEKEVAQRTASMADLAAQLRPFASPDSNLLIDRIERIMGRGTGSQSGQTNVVAGKSHPSVPPRASTVPPPSRASFTPPPPSFIPAMPSPAPQILPPASFGTTDTDLSSTTGPAKFRPARKGTVAAVLILGALGIAGAVVLLASLAESKPTPVDPPAAASPPPPVVETAPPPPPAVTTSAPLKPDKPNGKNKKHGHGKSDPTGERY